MWQSFVCAMVAAVTLQVSMISIKLRPIWLTSSVYESVQDGKACALPSHLQPDVARFWNYSLLCTRYIRGESLKLPLVEHYLFIWPHKGFYGGLIIKLNLMIASWRKTSFIRNYPISEVAIVALFSALVSYPVIFMRIQSTELVATLFQECHSQVEDILGICQYVAMPAYPTII